MDIKTEGKYTKRGIHMKKRHTPKRNYSLLSKKNKQTKDYVEREYTNKEGFTWKRDYIKR